MKTLYLDCGMGAAGDMLTAALLELLPEPEAFVAELNGLGIPGVEYRLERAESCGIRGSHMAVLVHGAEEGEEAHHHHDHGHHHEHEHDHHDHNHAHHHDHDHDHSGLDELQHLVREHLHLPEAVREDVLAVYGLLAEAESKVHGVPVTEIHFHEVGTLDALADITAVCLLMHRLAPEQVLASPVHVGSGTVRCAHGVLPVPAPAAAELLRDIPIYGGEIAGELCTPTGAALLRRFVTRFGDLPAMRTQAIGYGMGKKVFPRANCVRALLGETADETDDVLELACNLDDMSGEALGFAMEALLDAGALDVYTVPIGMKKSRPGVMLCVLCRAQDRERLAEAMFRHTTTLGIRETRHARMTLRRSIRTAETAAGPVRIKCAEGWGVQREKPEYDDLARIAREQNISLADAKNLIQ